MKNLSQLAVLLCGSTISIAWADRDHIETVELASQVLQEMSAVADRGVPPALMRKAAGVVVIPNVIKAGFVVGGRHGRGILVGRDPAGNWTCPVFVTITGGSIGFQAGVQSTDLILVLKSRRSMNDIIRRRKITLNADAGVAAGPVGREVGAGTDIEFRAEIYTYSRSRGLFAGASIDGSSLRVDIDANEDYYGNGRVAPNDILSGQYRSNSPATQKLLATLTNYSGVGTQQPEQRPQVDPRQQPEQRRQVEQRQQVEQRPNAEAPPNALNDRFQPPPGSRAESSKTIGAEAALVAAAAASIRELAGATDRAVPRKVAEQAYAVIVVPDLVRAGFVASGQYGRGLMVVRNWDGDWSNPVFVRTSGGGVGLQAGVQSSELILVFKTRRAVNEVIRRRKLTIGVDAAAAAGPVGREVGLATDADMRAEIFSYSKSRGLFAGAAIGGSVIRIDDDADDAFYRRDDIVPAQIISGEDLDSPPIAREFREAMSRGFPVPSR